jgi:hypothetical protein
MPVQSASLEVLEKAAVPPAQARAIVQAIEIEIAGSKETLATKQDALILRHELRHEMAELRVELRTEIVASRAELRSEIHGMATSLTRQMYTALLGQLAVLLGLAYFFVSHLPH